MSGYGRAYLWLAIIAGFAAISQSILELAADPPGSQWFVVALLTLVSGTATIKLPGVPAHISISESFLFTAVLLFGPAAGIATVVCDAIIASVRTQKRSVVRTLFNIAAPALSLWVASHLFYIPPLVRQDAPAQIGAIIGPLLLLTVVYFCLNSGMIAVAIGFQKMISPFGVWRDHLMWLSLNYFGGASVAALLVVYTREVNWTYLTVTLPLLLISVHDVPYVDGKSRRRQSSC